MENWQRSFLAVFIIQWAFQPIAAQESGTFEDEDTTLLVKPTRCIALRQGQYCYQKLHFSWEALDQTKHCLYSEVIESPLICWQAPGKHKLNYEFKSTEDVTFMLKNEVTGEIVSNVEIDVAWVYKSGKKVSTGWRLF